MNRYGFQIRSVNARYFCHQVLSPQPCVFRWELQPRDIPPLQRLANQRRSGGEVALVNQQHAKVVDGSERVWMPIAEGLALPLQRLAVQRFGCSKVALRLQHRAEVVDGVERARMPIAEDLAPPLQRLAEQRLSGAEVALGL